MILLTWLMGSALAFAASNELFVSHQLTPKEEYTKGIEGPAVDRDGNLFVVNFRQAGTIGKVDSAGHSTEAFRLPEGCIGNAIRFNQAGEMFIADYKQHNVFQRSKTQAPHSIFHDEKMHQPNDLTVAFNGEIFASDPDWKKGEGSVWHLKSTPDHWTGAQVQVPRKQGTVNGIDLSPDDRTLYVSESNRREIWAYKISGDELKDPRLVAKYPDFSLDGLRTDVTGRIYATRIEKGTIVLLSPDGKLEREVQLLGKNPSNLAFGGEDGKTVYVTQTDGRFVESFKVDQPGREWCLVQGRHIVGSACIK